jgi:excisionase family DNA binding protein
MADFSLEPPRPRLLTAGEVAELLRIPKSTVYELTRTRRLPHLKVGRRTLFDPLVLDEWIASRNVQTHDD